MLKLIRLFSLSLAFSIPFIISSCSTFDPSVVVPVYGHIDSVHFTTTADSQGTASASIPYAWVYLDDNPVGAFQMPCTFPMIASNGVHSIKIYPGVVPVGMPSPASINPFYQYYAISVNMQQGSTYKFTPASTYYSWVDFPYMENFEKENVGNPPVGIINYYGNGSAAGATNTTMSVTNKKGLTFQGNSGIVVVNSAHNYYIGITSPAKSLPNSSTPVWMELNYRTTAIFTIGMFDGDTATQSSPLALVYPTTKWTKMYVPLNTTIQAFSIQPQSVYFSLQLDAADGHTADTLLLDNIKILD